MEFQQTISLGESINCTLLFILILSAAAGWHFQTKLAFQRIIHLELEMAELKMEIQLIMRALRIRNEGDDERR